MSENGGSVEIMLENDRMVFAFVADESSLENVTEQMGAAYDAAVSSGIS